MFTQKFIDFLFLKISGMPVIEHRPEESPFSTFSLMYETKCFGTNFKSILQKMFDRAHESVVETVDQNIKRLQIPNMNTFVKIQRTGQNHPIHSDAGPNTYGSNDESDIQMSSIISINSSYEGGLINFPGADVSLKLQKGSMLIFPSHGHEHEVTEVTEGTRYTLLQFWEKN